MVIMIIRSIVLKDLYKVLNSLPSGTKKIDIEYVENEEETKIVIYPSSGSSTKDDSKVSGPSISSDDDLMNFI